MELKLFAQELLKNQLPNISHETLFLFYMYRYFLF